jgi:hypothetical protein
MRRRIYFMLPDRASARRTMDELLLQRIEERYIHFIARPDVSMEGLHEANVLHTTDLVHGAKLGALIGVAAGCVGGAVIQWLFVKDANYQIVTVIGMAAFGGLFGAWVASMVGSAVPNTQLRQFEREIAQGQILLMVDVPEYKAEEIKSRLGRAHPEGHDGGIEPNIPAFP